MGRVEELERPVVLNDGTYFYKAEDVLRHLEDEGFDIDSLARLLLFNSDIDIEQEYHDWKADGRCGDDWELIADGYFCAMRDMAQEVREACAEMKKHYSGVKTLKRIDDIVAIVDFHDQS